MHLRQPGFTYSAWGPSTKHNGRIQKFIETGDSRYIYQTELDKACFQHDMAYGDFKDFTRRTASDKILRDKSFNIAKHPNCNGYQRKLAPMVYKFFDKKNFCYTRAWSQSLWSEISRSETSVMQTTRAKRNKFAGSGIKN